MRAVIYSVLIILTVIGIGACATKADPAPQTETAIVVDAHDYEDQNGEFHSAVYVETPDGNVNLFDQSGFAEGDAVYILLDEQGNYDKLQHR